MTARDLSGQNFGRLTVSKRADNDRHNKARWLCLCSCGNERVVPANALTRGESRSCGCLRAESKPRLTHGLSYSTEHVIWQGMKSRCSNPKHASYPNYGGRGISVCPSWTASFETFLRDVGKRPSVLFSLDRRDTNGNYCPENCFWATPREQGGNRRNNRLIEYRGATVCVAEAVRLSGASVTPSQVIYRLKRGYSVEEALTLTRYQKYHRRILAEALPEIHEAPTAADRQAWAFDHARDDRKHSEVV